MFDNVRAKLAKKLIPKSNRTEELDKLIDFLGLERTDKGALSEATYYTCIKTLSETVGKLPLKLLKDNVKGGAKEDRKNPLYDVLRYRPNKYMSSTVFWSTVEYNRSHFGNSYVLISGAGKNLQLYILPSDQVEIWYDDGKILSEIVDIWYLYSVGGKKYKFASEEVMHFKTFDTIDGIVGKSVRDQLKSTIDGNTKGQELVNKMYDSGFTAKAVLQYTGSLNDDLVKTFTKGIEEYATGKIGEVKNIIPIPLGTTLTPLNVSLADNQFIDVKKYSALQIAAAFGIKPNQINDYSKSSFASAEAQQLSFLVDTLLFILKQYEDEISYKLLSQTQRSNGLKPKFNVNVILRADSKSQMEYLRTAVNGFILTSNEARAQIDYEALPGGDQLIGNGATIPIDKIGIQYEKLPKEGGE